MPLNDCGGVGLEWKVKFEGESKLTFRLEAYSRNDLFGRKEGEHMSSVMASNLRGLTVCVHAVT
jgi:hypothetical protein